MSVLCIVINGQFVKPSKFKKITRTNFVKSQLFPTFALLNTVLQARMAESVDALVSNTNVRKDVPVRPRLRVQRGWLLPSFFCTRSRGRTRFMPRGSAPIIPCGSAFRICLFHRQIHGSRRRAGARVRGGIFGLLWSWDFLDERRRVVLLGLHRIRGLSLWHCLWIWQSTGSAGFSRYSICLGALPL